jgi:hypothetical protein
VIARLSRRVAMVMMLMSLVMLMTLVAMVMMMIVVSVVVMMIAKAVGIASRDNSDRGMLPATPNDPKLAC